MTRIPVTVEPGTRFNRFVVIEEAERYISPKGRKRRQFKCKCDCGNIKVVDFQTLKGGQSQSCGCLMRETAGQYKKLHAIEGKRFGRLVAVKEAEPYDHPNGTKRRKFECLCDCGNTTEVLLAYLTTGHTQSCGCFRVDTAREKVTTHDLSKTPEYRTWAKMKERCLNSRCKNYKDYGGRGIRICDRWLNSFENFLEDMGNKPSSRHSIDRIDVNGDYCPSNTRWATAKQQGRNTRTNRLITYNNQTRCVSEWAEVIGCKEKAIRYQLNKGVSPEVVIGKLISE